MSDVSQVQLFVFNYLIEYLLLEVENDVVDKLDQFHLVIFVRLVENSEVLLYDIRTALFAHVYGELREQLVKQTKPALCRFLLCRLLQYLLYLHLVEIQQLPSFHRDRHRLVLVALDKELVYVPAKHLKLFKLVLWYRISCARVKSNVETHVVQGRAERLHGVLQLVQTFK